MPTRWIGPTALLLFSLSHATWAAAAPQSGSAEQPKVPIEVEVKDPGIDVTRLPINLSRIQRQLRQSTVREDHNGLNLRYIVDVYGQAPRLELLTKEDNLLNGPVPYGGPTHQDVLQMITPQEHRAPAADFGNLFRWLSGKAKDKSSK
jgi:hypothetical protein